MKRIILLSLIIIAIVAVIMTITVLIMFEPKKAEASIPYGPIGYEEQFKTEETSSEEIEESIQLSE